MPSGDRTGSRSRRGRSIDLTRRYGIVHLDGVRLPLAAVVGDGRRRRRRRRASARDRPRPAVRRDRRRRRPRVRVHPRVHAGPLRLRSADRVVPGAQAPDRRHAARGSSVEGDRRRRGPRHRRRDPDAAAIGPAWPRRTWATRPATSSTTACRSRRHRRDVGARHPPVPAAGWPSTAPCTARPKSTRSASPRCSALRGTAMTTAPAGPDATDDLEDLDSFRARARAFASAESAPADRDRHASCRWPRPSSRRVVFDAGFAGHRRTHRVRRRRAHPRAPEGVRRGGWRPGSCRVPLFGVDRDAGTDPARSRLRRR